MGIENVDIETNEPKTTYKVIRFQASRLPEQYQNLVLSKFLRSLRYGNQYFSFIDAHPYFEMYGRYFKNVLQRPDAVIRLAVLSDDEDVVLGWSLIEAHTLHYVYVNKDNRKLGIGKSLTETNLPFDTITHLTAIGLSIWSSKFHNGVGPNILNKPKIVFNPFC